MGRKKKLPIGIEFFKDFKRDDFYYVDKTNFIRDFIEWRGSREERIYRSPPAGRDGNHPQIRNRVL